MFLKTYLSVSLVISFSVEGFLPINDLKTGDIKIKWEIEHGLSACTEKIMHEL